MNDFTEQEIDRLHVKLAGIYRRGRLTSGEQITVQGLWARIERLEASRLAIMMREAKVGA